MPVIDLTTEIHASLDRVFDLARSVDLHTASTAQTGERAVAGVVTGLMHLGDEVTWGARHFGFWQHLTSRITIYDRPIHFRDSMVRGIFRRFDHDHFFAPRSGVTFMRDVLDYKSPWGVLGRVADRLAVTRHLERLLLRRNAVIKTAAETDQWKRFLSEPRD
ncbi:MAG: cell division protein [Chthoniobacterales bacterium]|nr:MAG: cell division protein [Chthoniobacterales bacterium]